jgi:hypothetical protein
LFREVDEIAAQILSLKSENEVRNELNSLLGESKECIKFINQLVSKMYFPKFQRKEKEQKKEEIPVMPKNSVGVQKSQGGRKKKENIQPFAGPDTDLSTLIPYMKERNDDNIKVAVKSQPDKKKKENKNPKIIHGVQNEIILPQRIKCSCHGSRHLLLNNCLKCGRIVCAQEGAGPCLFCGNVVRPRPNYEAELLKFNQQRGLLSDSKTRSYLFIYLFIHLFIYLFIYLSIYFMLRMKILIIMFNIYIPIQHHHHRYRHPTRRHYQRIDHHYHHHHRRDNH